MPKSGELLPYVASSAALRWFVPGLFVVLHPLVVSPGTRGEAVTLGPRTIISWFGIRGIGPIYYLKFAIPHGVTGALAHGPITLTLVTAAVSVHERCVGAPLIKRYVQHESSAP